MKKLFAVASVFAAFLLALPAAAQVGYGKVETPWFQQGKISGGISATGSSSATALPTAGLIAWICNTGANDVYLAFGRDNTVAATVNGSSWLKAGTCGNYDLLPFSGTQFSFVAAITSTSTSTLTVETGLGSGPQQLASSGGGGGGGTVTQGPTGSNAAAWWVQIGDTTNGPAAVKAASTAPVATDKALVVALSPNGPVPASENHIGEVGGNAFPITNAMTTTNATVTTGQSIGGLQTLANAVRVSAALGGSGTSGYIQNTMVTFTDAVGAGPLDVYYFNASPTGSTCTNASAFVLANADRDKVIGIVHVTDFTASNTAAVAQAYSQAMLYGVASATSIFGCVVARASFVITGTANASLKTTVIRN